MSIETATPSSAETLAALFDKLVDAVAERVRDSLAEKITELVDSAVEAAMYQHTSDYDHDDFLTDSSDLDIEDKVTDAVRDCLSEARIRIQF